MTLRFEEAKAESNFCIKEKIREINSVWNLSLSLSLSLSKSSKVLTEGLHFEKLQLIDFPVAVQDYHAGCVQFAPDLSLLSSPLERVSLFSFLFFFC